jgi:hypothetical protein
VALDDGIQLRVQVARVMRSRPRDVSTKTEQVADFLHILGNKDELAAFDPQHVGMMNAATPGNLKESESKRMPPLAKRGSQALRAFCTESSTHCADYVLDCAKGRHVAIYVDNERIQWRGKLWCHLVADSLDELHAFAAALGLKRAWFQGKASYPHYDVTTGVRGRALAMGAIAAGKTQMLASARKMKNELLEEWQPEMRNAGPSKATTRDDLAVASDCV